ncbi:MAG TPA: glucose 1-dehydrogenase [Candidatus Sumerlaeota bacterium]|nr:glucose 1-dehydrogenase [Candidatus Sumerlaeota bacterium]HOR27114.1 glucose 1-dehydrogenase [Candidatus Sumerlaeota bacterium]HPK02732.1 glucose 1-dehydrogenase [Candidatus Sumerlaeota bacterium]
MRAIGVFPRSRQIDLVELDEPLRRGRHDVKVRMLEVGLCGTDREIVSFQYGAPPPGSSFLVIGHEGLGLVADVGPAVAALRPGDLVIPMVRRPCPHAHCRPCRAHRADFCYTGDFTERGIKAAHGFTAETVVDPEQFFIPVPSELRHIAVLTEPLTIAEKALTQVWDVQERLPGPSRHKSDRATAAARLAGDLGQSDQGFHHRAVVLGAGPVGLLGAMLLVLTGFETTVYSREPAGGPKARLAQQIGARYLSAADADPPDLARAVGNIDLVYEATGAAEVSFALLRELGANGVFVFTGVPGRKHPIQCDAAAIMQNLVLRNQVVLGTVNAGRDAYRAAVDDLGRMARRWPGVLQQLITARHPLEDFRRPLLDHPAGIKHVLVHGADGS